MDGFTVFLLLLLFSGFALGGKKHIVSKAPYDEVKKQLEDLAPVTLSVDLSGLPENEVHVVKLLAQAAQVMDEIFLSQVYEHNPALLEELRSSQDPQDQAYLTLFRAMVGPWNRLQGNRPFINKVEKPLGANYYPADLTREELETWLQDHPGDRESFESTFTVIRRQNGNLIAIPYSQYYKTQLIVARDLLKQAASLTSDATLKTFLNSRADAFFSNDYFESDMAWMDLSGDIEVVIGPYEVYEDALMGYKAAFEAFVCVVDHEESQKLEKIGHYLDDMERNLPLPDSDKNFERGESSPFKVVNEVFTGGDTKAGSQTLAFNLPNDERVREAKGSKKVMLKNVMRAKFDKILMPIVENVLAEKDLRRVSFEGYFNHILMHEVSHGLGPGTITVQGEETTVNKTLKELYSTIEECKADVLGVLNVQYLIDNGVFPKSLENTLYASNVGGMFRSIRFGLERAHGGGVAIQLNYYMDSGAVTVDGKGRFHVNDKKMKEAVRALAAELLMIQARGDYEGAQKLIEKYRIIRPEVQKALDRLTQVPVDIRPIYPIQDSL
jgi:hypothetical protein